MIKKLSRLIQKAHTSSVALWMLNRVINHAVRFNKPHGFKIVKITPEVAQTYSPYHKKNFNHVRGIHACAIATVGELAAGLILMNHFSPEHYRVIMSTLHIDYHYQAKRPIFATASLSNEDLKQVRQSLEDNKKGTQTVITEIKDDQNQAVATVSSVWQIKHWNAVKTAV